MILSVPSRAGPQGGGCCCPRARPGRTGALLAVVALARNGADSQFWRSVRTRTGRAADSAIGRRGATAHRRDFLVVTGPAGRDGRQPPGVQQPLQLAVTSRIMRGVHGGVVLAEELVVFLRGQVPENDRWVIRVLNLGWFGGHVMQATPESGQIIGLRNSAGGPGSLIHAHEIFNISNMLPGQRA